MNGSKDYLLQESSPKCVRVNATLQCYYFMNVNINKNVKF